jgi:GalNAc-alpha-(1->4)-GalNAc-alpha-(1->3)-diNAcBac-PP-undecaprenol alpha-1,4-N-acetyl-D-galactosaminyltransferase
MGIDTIKGRYHRSNLYKIGNPFYIHDNTLDMNVREKLIVNIGYLGGKKNQDLLIQFFADLNPIKDWKLYLVGTGPEKLRIKKLIDDLELANQAYLMGSMKDTTKLLRQTQIFAFTSTSEGFPNVLGEAMASVLIVLQVLQI